MVVYRGCLVLLVALQHAKSPLPLILQHHWLYYRRLLLASWGQFTWTKGSHTKHFGIARFVSKDWTANAFAISAVLAAFLGGDADSSTSWAWSSPLAVIFLHALLNKFLNFKVSFLFPGFVVIFLNFYFNRGFPALFTNLFWMLVADNFIIFWVYQNHFCLYPRSRLANVYLEWI